MRSLLDYFPSRFDDFLAIGFLDILGLSGAEDTTTESGIGYTGFIGSSLVMFAVLSMIWAGLSPDSSKEAWDIMAFILIAGIAISIAYGFKFKKKVSVMNELLAVGVGIVAGLVMTSTQIAVFEITDWVPYANTTAESVWLIMVAPVAETMMFNIAIYHWFRSEFPEISWAFIAIASDIAFALAHYFRYGLHPDFIIILIILIISNTILTYIYDLTRNATAPMIGHTVVNFATAPVHVLISLEAFVYLFLVVFLIILIFYTIIGGIFGK